MLHALAIALTLATQAPDPADAKAANAPLLADVIATLGLGLSASAPLAHGTTLYAPLASGGVAIIDVTDAQAPRLVGRILEGRAVSRLVLVDGQLMAVVVHEEALTFSLADPLAPTAVLPLLPAGPTGDARVLAAEAPRGW